MGLFPDLSGAAWEVVKQALASFLLPEALDLLNPGALDLLAPALGLPAARRLRPGRRPWPAAAETVERQIRDMATLIPARRGHGAPLPARRSPSRTWAAITEYVRGPCPTVPPGPLHHRSAHRPHGQADGLRPGPGHRAGTHCGPHGPCRERRLCARLFRPADGSSGDGAMPGMAAAIEILRREADCRGGSLVLQEAPPRLKAAWMPGAAPGAGFAMMRRIKAEFDPQRVCSPGRFVGGI